MPPAAPEPGVSRSPQAARRGDIQAHRGAMKGLFTGALVVAGALAFAPGRTLHQWLVQLF